MARRDAVKRWVLYIDESGDFADAEDDVAITGLLVSDDLPGLSPTEVRRSLEAAVPGFPWPWHARLQNSPSWVALVLADSSLTPSHPDPDIRWLAGAVRRVNERFEARHGALYHNVRRDLHSGNAGNIDLGQLAPFDGVLRTECVTELAALRAHAHRAAVAVKDFANGIAARAAHHEARPLAMLVCASETSCGDAVGAPDSALGDRRYFTLLEVLIDRCAYLLTRRGGSHELLLDLSERRMIVPELGRSARMNTVYVGREMAEVITKWGDVDIRIVPASVTRFDSDAGARFVVADFAANRGRRVLKQNATPLIDVESGLTQRLGLSVRSGTPALSHLSASGDAYELIWTFMPLAGSPQTALPFEAPRRRWACEQAWEWWDAVQP